MPGLRLAFLTLLLLAVIAATLLSVVVLSEIQDILETFSGTPE